MFSDKIRFFGHILIFIPPYIFTLLRQRILAFIHKLTYTALPTSQTKNIIVVGGSFAGYQLAKRLTETLPTGYRIVLVEKNSDFNYLFAFPRFSVVKGYEQYAFIPYAGLAKNGPAGIFRSVQDTAVEIGDGYITLQSGERIGYAYLVIATGTSSSLPSKVVSTDSESGQKELRAMQDRVADAGRIAVVGGGAVGIELATDIKTFFPTKDVTVIHSRDRLLQNFGMKLHEYVMKMTKEMGVDVLLNERPDVLPEQSVLDLSHGKRMEFDLIIPCTGQRPNSSVIASISPASLSETAHILVKPTLQIFDDSLPNIFAFGDVAETGGPKMARASYFQSEIVCQNILALIKGKDNLRAYVPLDAFEGSIKLTLGKTSSVMWMKEDSGHEILIPINTGQIDLGVKRQWSFFNVSLHS